MRQEERTDFRRIVRIPAPLIVERCRRAPEVGPRILFFSGGTALRGLSRKLKTLTHNSTHLMTPFDSGGRSARLRDSFRMPAVGDIRNRLIALADDTVLGNHELYRLFAFRLPTEGEPDTALPQLERMVEGTDPLVDEVPNPLRRIVQTHLRSFLDQMPADFDLRGASIGNLMLAGGYLHHDRYLDSVVLLFSRLVVVRGVVSSIIDADLELCATLSDGRKIVGQHLLTGKEAPPLDTAIEDLCLVHPTKTDEVATPEIARKTARAIRKADLICFPMGSFWSSLIANLLPVGVGRAIASSIAPKVYVPSTGHDPELVGVPPERCVQDLLRYLRRDLGPDDQTPVEHLLDAVLLHTDHSVYALPPDVEKIRALGVRVIETDLVTDESTPRIDSERLANVLVSLA